MEAPRLADVPAFSVTGLTVRTTNEREMSGDTGQIGPLWGTFFAGGAEPAPAAIFRGVAW